MENQTSITEFHILSFFASSKYKPILFCVFLLLFLMGILMNTTIITVISQNKHLHTPMYFFLCNLAFLDIFFTTTTVPLLLYMLSSGNNTISLTKCFTQMYFFFIASSTEVFLLVTMAYDRYVAICKPLHYHRILSRKTCTVLNLGTWVIGALNSVILTIPATKLSFCHSNIIKHYFCDAKALTRIACAGTDVFYTSVYADFFLMAFCPFLCYLASYGKVIRVILSIKSKDGRQKAFSTCSSHIIVILLYFSLSGGNYLMSSSEYFAFQEQVVTALYANVTPLVNPVIYSLRSKELKQALQELLRKLINV
uniref:Olfactory receptor n=1 Tax=Pyxicephalus adspersus TaxID=30357 RepID=A0AAV3A421_PYXAD|nr:TPA: hypothetical protein GDO54_015013 [Pyxicephalus adspersus]